MKLGIIGVLWVLAVVWVAIVAFVVFNLDPKFGGPARWWFVVSPLFLVYGVAPVAHILALAYAIRFRVRSMLSAQARSGWDEAVFGAVVLFFVTFPTIYIQGFMPIGYGAVLDLQRWLMSSISSPIYMMLILAYFAVALMIVRPSGRVFILPAALVVICYVGFVVESFALTEVTRNSEGTIVRVQDHSPKWIEQAQSGFMSVSSLLFFVAFAQIMISSFLGLVRLFKRRPGPA